MSDVPEWAALEGEPPRYARDTWHELQTARVRERALTLDLLFLCGQLESGGELDYYGNPLIRIWWEKHRADEENMTREQMREILGENSMLEPHDVARLVLERRRGERPVSQWHVDRFLAMAREECPKAVARSVAMAEREGVRSAALSKLSPEEREALGV